MEERLDMLPVNKQIGFFSDAYSAEWTYAKATMVRNQLAQVLARKIRQGQYTLDEATAVARAILFDGAATTLGHEANGGGVRTTFAAGVATMPLPASSLAISHDGTLTYTFGWVF